MGKTNNEWIRQQKGFLIALIKDRLRQAIPQGLDNHVGVDGEYRVYDTPQAKSILLATQSRVYATVGGCAFTCEVKCKGIGAGCHKVWLEWRPSK